jgi:hypothetical protein
MPLANSRTHALPRSSTHAQPLAREEGHAGCLSLTDAPTPFLALSQGGSRERRRRDLLEHERREKRRGKSEEREK